MIPSDPRLKNPTLMQQGALKQVLKKWDKDLHELETFITEAETPVTVRQIVERFQCSKQAAHHRINQLKKKRVMKVTMLREGFRGPNSKGYSFGK